MEVDSQQVKMHMQELLSALAKVGLVIAPPAPRDED